MKEIEKDGNRIYIFDRVVIVPCVEDIILYTTQHKNFIDSATMNPKFENAELYSQFTEETYKAFIYAFAVQFGRLFSLCIGEQFETNARRVEKLCKKRGIVLSEKEQEILDKCKNFVFNPIKNKDKIDLSKSFCSDLVEMYMP